LVLSPPPQSPLPKGEGGEYSKIYYLFKE